MAKKIKKTHKKDKNQKRPFLEHPKSDKKDKNHKCPFLEHPKNDQKSDKIKRGWVKICSNFVQKIDFPQVQCILAIFTPFKKCAC